jgi:hypothetical protein
MVAGIMISLNQKEDPAADLSILCILKKLNQMATISPNNTYAYAKKRIIIYHLSFTS